MLDWQENGCGSSDCSEPLCPSYVQPTCRCCGKAIRMTDNHPIHTTCISKHWGKHFKGINASRCQEFGRK
jgi:hypothetical protein